MDHENSFLIQYNGAQCRAVTSTLTKNGKKLMRTCVVEIEV